MKVRYIGKTVENFIVKNNRMHLIPEKVYDVINVEKHGWYRLIDESGEDYLYPPSLFGIVEE